MLEAKQNIESQFPSTKVLTYAASITDHGKVQAIVKEIGTIDVLVLNAGIMHTPGGVLELNADQLLDAFQTNVIGPWNLMKAFVALTPRAPGAERTIIYTSTAGIHLPAPGIAGYNASKAAGTYLTSSVAQEYGDKGIRVFAFHPVVAYTPMARDGMGLKEDSLPFDSRKCPPNEILCAEILTRFFIAELGAHFAVWLSSPEADFVKGRFLWSNWDVDELRAKKALIESDPSQLSIGLALDKVVA